MKTKYIGIESICVVTQDFEATIACNIMLEGKNYDSPVYANIFCHWIHLEKFLKLDSSDLSKRIVEDLDNLVMYSLDKKVVQLDLPSYVNKNVEWNFPIMVNLIEVENHRSDIQYYRLGH